ncbi:MAG: IS630 family transposase, partial [Gammaproteobacteria bacterium]|nr:IS630 family transposase [Gammaproteobacteria bacterium]
FVDQYIELKASAEKAGEPIYFMDASHPEHQTKMAYGWIKKGERKLLPTTATQKRVHLLGALNLAGHRIIYGEYDKVNGEHVIAFLKQVRKGQKNNKLVHIILDNVSYHKSTVVQATAHELNIQLHYLPPYSPNLNPIERLWKIMHEQVTYNRYYQKFSEFREAIRYFFRHIGKKKKLLRSRITDNFQILQAPNFAS